MVRLCILCRWRLRIPRWNRRMNNDSRSRQVASRDRTRGSSPTPRTYSSAKSKGAMIYFANHQHESLDNEYQFEFVKTNRGWRAYILRMPSLCGRPSSLHVTHRLKDVNNRHFVCWDSTITTEKDMMIVAKRWADCLQKYIETGRRF